MKKLHLAFILTCFLMNFPAIAEQFQIEPQTQGAVSFVSGGVGTEEQNFMQAVQADYNLNLLFSLKGSGEYLSDVKVHISDSSGNTLLEAVAEGPKFFAKLKPGRYSVTADLNGQLIHKTTTVGNHRAYLSFTWLQEQGD